MFFFFKLCPNLEFKISSFLPEPIDLDQKFLRISHNTFKINHRKHNIRKCEFYHKLLL